MSADKRQSDIHKMVYREEAYELLAELEDLLLELEHSPTDMGLINRIFRAMHTIKGSGSMFGFDDIAAFTHEIETVYDHLRNSRISVTRDLIDLSLQARDYIKRMIDASQGGSHVDEQEGGQLIEGLLKLVPQDVAAQGATSAKPKPSVPKKEVEQPRATEPPAQGRPLPLVTAQPEHPPKLQGASTYRIIFHPAPDIFLRGVNPLFILHDLKQLGPCLVVAQMKDIPSLEQLDPDTCYTYWEIILTTRQGINAIKDVFIFVEEGSDINITLLDEGTGVVDEDDYKKLGEILVERGDITDSEIKEAMGEKRLLGEVLVERGYVEPMQVASALQEQDLVKGIRKERHAVEAATSIRVPADKLDKLVDLVGELVTVQARLTQRSKDNDDASLRSIAEEVERLVAELHDNTMSIRMVPIGSTFSRFRRLVRDLSAELGKNVSLVTAGADTELDKGIIEKLSDPLVHIMRNCLDHGIEHSDARQSAGKPASATITLAARHSGADVLIEISDDGAGLDLAAIRGRAIERGLIREEDHLDDHSLANLIFLPGFSTAKVVTGVSGRGVGMDVVKRSLDALRGAVEIDTKQGLGTKVTLKIPLTLAIIEGLLVRVGPDFYVIPLSLVEECVELTHALRNETHGRNLVRVRDAMVPFIELRQRFGMDGTPPDIEQVILVSSDRGRTGIVVDQVIGGHQTVIKTLGRAYKGISDVSGATILGDGTVALIMDVPMILQTVEAESIALYGNR